MLREKSFLIHMSFHSNDANPCAQRCSVGPRGRETEDRGAWASQGTGKHASILLPWAGGTRAAEKLSHQHVPSFCYLNGSYSSPWFNMELDEERMESAKSGSLL